MTLAEMAQELQAHPHVESVLFNSKNGAPVAYKTVRCKGHTYRIGAPDQTTLAQVAAALGSPDAEIVSHWYYPTGAGWHLDVHVWQGHKLYCLDVLNVTLPAPRDKMTSCTRNGVLGETWVNLRLSDEQLAGLPMVFRRQPSGERTFTLEGEMSCQAWVEAEGATAEEAMANAASGRYTVVDLFAPHDFQPEGVLDES